MSDMREIVVGKNRSALDDEHTAKLYALYRERTKAVNSLISTVVAASVFALLIALVIAVAVTVRIWQWAL